MSTTHIPRRSGSTGTVRDLGPRQVLPPSKPKYRRPRWRSGAPEVCGAKHPDLDITCGSETHIEDTAIGGVLSELMGLSTVPVKIQHRGKHRATVLDGIRVRWDDSEVPA